MSNLQQTYCLDSNVLIQAWQKYYSPNLCPSYWENLDQLGIQHRIFICEHVRDEVVRTDDDLSKWLKNSKIPVQKTTEAVTLCLKEIYSANPNHKLLVDSSKKRSLADPWVIAHAKSVGAIVVTKEEKITAANTNHIKIPNVCDNMNIPWMNDFEFVKQIGIRFTCSILEN